MNTRTRKPGAGPEASEMRTNYCEARRPGGAGANHTHKEAGPAPEASTNVRPIAKEDAILVYFISMETTDRIGLPLQSSSLRAAGAASQSRYSCCSVLACCMMMAKVLPLGKFSAACMVIPLQWLAAVAAGAAMLELPQYKQQF